MCFREKIIVSNGEEIVNEVHDYYEHYLGNYNTYEEFVNDYKESGWVQNVTEEQFNKAKKYDDCIEETDIDWEPYTILLKEPYTKTKKAQMYRLN